VARTSKWPPLPTAIAPHEARPAEAPPTPADRPLEPLRRRDVLLGVGDDAALLVPPAGYALAAATDTLVEGRHFLEGAPGRSIGHQSLAVNLSDLAAMGADPAWALLSLSLPEVREDWLEDFASGFFALADAQGDLETALAEYRRALALDPRFTPAAVNLADLLLRHTGANHKRETIAFSKRRQGALYRVAI